MRAVRILDIPISTTGKINYETTLRALVRRVCGEDLPTDRDELSMVKPQVRFSSAQHHMADYATSHLFAAKFLQLWVRSVYQRRKAVRTPLHGTLVLEALTAQHLRDLDMFGRQDP